MQGQWLVKVNHYQGGESVIAYRGDKVEAQALADYYNSVYQADNYYIEAWDKEKAGLFNMTSEMYLDILKKIKAKIKK